MTIRGRALTWAIAGSMILGGGQAASADDHPRIVVARPSASCAVSGATFTWGVKESFRAYISSSIANGNWTTSGKVDYSTPVFTWRDGSGTISRDGRSLVVRFTGSIRFVGHGGALDLVIRDPTIRLDLDRSSIALSVASAQLEGAPVRFDQTDFAAGPAVAGSLAKGGVALHGLSLTKTGATAFSGFYAAREPVDDSRLTYRVAPSCVHEASPALPWLVFGAVAIVLLGGGTAWAALSWRRNEVDA